MQAIGPVLASLCFPTAFAVWVNLMAPFFTSGTISIYPIVSPSCTHFFTNFFTTFVNTFFIYMTGYFSTSGIKNFILFSSSSFLCLQSFKSLIKFWILEFQVELIWVMILSSCSFNFSSFLCLQSLKSLIKFWIFEFQVELIWVMILSSCSFNSSSFFCLVSF